MALVAILFCLRMATKAFPTSLAYAFNNDIPAFSLFSFTIFNTFSVNSFNLLPED